MDNRIDEFADALTGWLAEWAEKRRDSNPYTPAQDLMEPIPEPTMDDGYEEREEVL